MLDIERKAKIIELLHHDGRVEVNNLAKMFKVTGATIRRDLNQLEKEGVLQRAHGGGVLKKGTLAEPSFTSQLKKATEEKEQIAAEAVKHIKPGESIFLDSSSTVLQIAKYLDKESHLFVVTNSLYIANELTQYPNIELIMLGGLLRYDSKTLVGPLTEKNIKDFKIDKAFLGISAINKKGELTDPNIYEANMKKNIIEMAQEVIGVADSSKFNKESFSFIATVSKLSKMIIDRATTVDSIQLLKNHGVEVIIA